MDGMAQVTCSPHPTSNGRWAKDDESNNRMHATRDTSDAIKSQLAGGRVMRGVIPLLIGRDKSKAVVFSEGQIAKVECLHQWAV
jgi:hypothetical protein